MRVASLSKPHEAYKDKMLGKVTCILRILKSRKERHLLLHAITYLLYGHIIIQIKKEGIIFRHFDKNEMLYSVRPDTDSKNATAADIKIAISRGLKIIPMNIMCLAQAYCASRLLSKAYLPWSIDIGVLNQGKVLAHAWSKSGCHVITGATAKDYKVIKHYSSQKGK